jgi:pimeloyl-ACP methyl ester carboxylesterase
MCRLPESVNLRVERLRADGSMWDRSDIASLLDEPQRPVMVFIHGNRYSHAEARQQGLELARRAAACGNADMRTVVYSWPSEQQGILLKDGRAKYERAFSEGHYLAWLLGQLEPGRPVAIVGYSYGAIITLEAIEDLAIAEQVVLEARAVPTEAEGAPASDEGGIGPLESRRNGAGGSAHQRGIELRCLAGDVVQILTGHDHRRPRNDGATGGPVDRVVEQQPLTDRLAGAQRHEAVGPAVAGLLDRDGTADQDGKSLARLAFGENGLVDLERERGDVTGQLPEVRVGEPFEERGSAQQLGDFSRCGHGGE